MHQVCSYKWDLVTPTFTYNLLCVWVGGGGGGGTMVVKSQGPNLLHCTACVTFIVCSDSVTFVAKCISARHLVMHHRLMHVCAL